MRVDIWGLLAKSAIAVGSLMGVFGLSDAVWAQGTRCFATQACTTNRYTGPTGYYCSVPAGGSKTTDPFKTGLYYSNGLCADEYDAMGPTGFGCGDTFAAKC